MSRIGKLPISIPENIKVSLINNEVVLDSMYVYEIYDKSQAKLLALDTLEYSPNSSNLTAIAGSTHYKFKSKVGVYLRSKSFDRQLITKNASTFTAKNSIGFRCCAWKK